MNIAPAILYAPPGDHLVLFLLVIPGPRVQGDNKRHNSKITSTENEDIANKMVEFLTSDEIQTLIGEYGVKEHGRQLFMPAAGKDL